MSKTSKAPRETWVAAYRDSEGSLIRSVLQRYPFEDLSMVMDEFENRGEDEGLDLIAVWRDDAVTLEKPQLREVIQEHAGCIMGHAPDEFCEFCPGSGEPPARIVPFSDPAA